MALGLDYGLTHSCYDPLPPGRAVRPMRQLCAARAGFRGSGREEIRWWPMSSERLYYTDAYLVEFDAVVREVSPQGDRWKVVARSHGVLPDVRRPALRYRHARRGQRPRRLRSGRRHHRPPGRSRAREELPRARPRRLEPPLRSHAAAHGAAPAVCGVRARG